MSIRPHATLNKALPAMSKYRTRAGMAACLACASLAVAQGGDFGAAGSESVLTSVTESVHAATAPMYRLPATDQAIAIEPTTAEPTAIESSPAEPVTPVDEPASETWDTGAEIRPLPAITPQEVLSPHESSPQDVINELEAGWPAGFVPSTGFEPAPEPPTIEMQEPITELHQPSRATPYTPEIAELSQQLLPVVQKAYALAKHGAVYAAQTEFIRVLRRVAQAKDAAKGVDTHSHALAAGLRALDEADDFTPQGTQLEAEMNVAVVMSTHRTAELLTHTAITRPDEAIGLYHQVAREQLAFAVGNEQAGSMSLYGLGKVENRLARDTDGELRHERKALTMFQAALDAGPGNHMAANEVGVLLSRGGQPLGASEMFRRAIDIAPASTSYHNLAVVERKMGYHEQAAANEQYALHLAARDRMANTASRNNGVQWVAPQELSRVAQSMPANENRMTNAAHQQPMRPMQTPPAVGQAQTAAKWSQKLVPGILRR